jgi:hypothetical protein
MDDGSAPTVDDTIEQAAAAAEGQDAAPNADPYQAEAVNAASDPDPNDPIYVSKKEVRKNAGKGTGKKFMYFLEFFLVDNHGYETLAATGEDQGGCSDACYCTIACPSLHCMCSHSVLVYVLVFDGSFCRSLCRS